MQIVTDFTAIISDTVWRNGFGDQRFVITYGFANALPDHQSNERNQAFRDSFSAHSDAAKATAREAFQMWEDASALKFIEVDADDADMVLGLFDFDTSPETQAIDGFAFFPGESKITGDVFINEGSSTSLSLYLHEIGHALGLEHSFEGDFVLPESMNSRDFTVMSSFGPNANALRELDIQAIQFMYGLPADTPAAVIPAVGYSNGLISRTSFFSSLNDLTYGDTGAVTIRVSNFGEDAFGGGMDVALVLSRDEVVDSGDQVIGAARVRDLAAGGESGEISINYSIFDDIAQDNYNVLLVLDPTNEVAETRELDNVSALSLSELSEDGSILRTPLIVTVSGEIGSNPGESPPPFLVDPRTGARDPSEPSVDDPRPDDPPNDPPVDPVDPPVEEPPADDPVDPPADDPVDPPVDEPPVDDPADPPIVPDPQPEDPNGATDGPDILTGTNAADQIDGGGGADEITGGGGGDTLNGGGGGDTLIGNGGRDQLTGGGGKDNLLGGGGRDLLIGNGGKDTLDGGGGKDDLQGGGGKDLLLGGGGRDRLDGGGGKDTMEGGNGRDDILGGRGTDILTGDGGADRFIFDRGNGRDTITDFQQGRDKIVIEGGADSFDDLGVLQLGDDVMIRFSNTRVIVENDQVDNFTAADFIF